MKHIVGKGTPPSLSDWEFVGKTPQGGKEYYNKEAVMVAIEYLNCIKVFSDIAYTTTARLPYPADFRTCTYYEKQ